MNDPEKIAQIAVNYGLGIVLSIGMAWFMVWLLKYVFKQNEVREQRLSELIVKDIALTTKSLIDHEDKSSERFKRIDEANRRQREEHEAHNKKLDKIEEENERRREAQIEIISSLKEIHKSLSMLNEKEVYFQKKRLT